MQGNGTASCYESRYNGACQCNYPSVRGSDGYSCVLTDETSWSTGTAMDNATLANCTTDLFAGSRTCVYTDQDTGSTVFEVADTERFELCAPGTAYSEVSESCVVYLHATNLTAYAYTKPAYLKKCASSEDCTGQEICWSESRCWCQPGTRVDRISGQCVWADDNSRDNAIILPGLTRAQLADCSGNTCTWIDYRVLATAIWDDDGHVSILTLPAKGWMDPQSYPSYALSPATSCENGVIVEGTTLCKCDAGFFGINCDQSYSDCAEERCSGKGECLHKTYGCRCGDDRAGDHCELVICRNGGTVVNNTCNCTSRWEGESCTEFVCGSTIHTYNEELDTCECKTDTLWTKDAETGKCTVHPCGGEGRGVPSGTGAYCVCEPGRSFHTDKGYPFCR